MIRVRVGEEQVELARAQLGRDRRLFFGDLLRELGVAGGQLVELDQVAGPLLQQLPGLDEIAILGCLARERTRSARVVPNAWLR